MGWIDLPDAGDVRLTNARVPASLLDTQATEGAGFASVALDLHDGVVKEIGPAGGEGVDLGGAIVTPALVDCHTHLDKCHILARCPSPGGDLRAAIDAVDRDKRRWDRADLRRRAGFGLASAHAHGVRAMRSHVDADPASQAPADALATLAELRDEWADSVELQLATLSPIDAFADAAWAGSLADRVRETRGVLGAFVYLSPDRDRLVTEVLDLAGSRGLDVDFHVDETLDPEADGLRRIADAVIETGFSGRVLCGHACSLAVQNDVAAQQTTERVAEAKIHVVTLPLSNLYLQDRGEGRTPRRRGLTLVHELRRAGVGVSIATDNVGDPFFPYGDFDPLEAFRVGVSVGHLEDPATEWIGAVTRSPAEAMGLQWDGVLRPGCPADLVLWNARAGGELLARPQADRVVLRAGRPLDDGPPDFRRLANPPEREA